MIETKEMTDQKDDGIRSSIIEAAQRLFQQYGLAKTTMEDIAREIGKGKSTLYYYYPNKDEIFVAVVQKEKFDVAREVQHAIAREHTGKTKLVSFGMARLRALRKKKVLYKILSNEIEQNLCIVKKLRNNYNEIELDLIQDILRFGMSRGEFNVAEADVEVTSYIINSALRGLEFDAMMSIESRFENSAHVVEKAIHMLVNALSC